MWVELSSNFCHLSNITRPFLRTNSLFEKPTVVFSPHMRACEARAVHTRGSRLRRLRPKTTVLQSTILATLWKSSYPDCARLASSFPEWPPKAPFVVCLFYSRNTFNTRHSDSIFPLLHNLLPPFLLFPCSLHRLRPRRLLCITPRNDYFWSCYVHMSQVTLL